MKKIILLSFVLLPFVSICQTVFWTETFDNACSSGCLASTYSGTNGAWNVAASGTNGANPNIWFVSYAENGNAVGTCGSAGGGNATLHIGANPGSYCTCFYCADPSGDCGASYDACNAANNFCAGGSPLAATTAISPTISTVGKTQISISFDYIASGQTGKDFASVFYSVDNGVTWTAIVNPLPKSVNTGCAGQGKWTNYTSAVLPATADNNPSFKLSFAWQNNADNIGTDPSVAINDLKVRYVTLLPLVLENFSAIKQNNDVIVHWTTASELNTDKFEILASNSTSSRSTPNFNSLGNVVGAGNSTTPKSYTFIDRSPNKSGTYYYKLKEIDKDGNYTYSNIAAVNFDKPTLFNLIGVNPNPFSDRTTLQMYMSQRGLLQCKVFDVAQRLVSAQQADVSEGNFVMDIDKAGNLPSGVYFVHLIFNNEQVVTKVVKK